MDGRVPVAWPICIEASDNRSPHFRIGRAHAIEGFSPPASRAEELLFIAQVRRGPSTATI